MGGYGIVVKRLMGLTLTSPKKEENYG